MENRICLGINDKGLQVWVSPELLYKYGEQEVRKRLGLSEKLYPAATCIGKEPHPVMVRAESQEDAIRKYLNRKHK